MTRLLIVDDDEIALELMSEALSSTSDCSIETVTSGREALARVLRGDISIVISDWMMPGLDGVELCRRIRAADLSRYTYFVLVTSRDGSSALDEGLSAGADEFIAKPFDPLELNARVRSIRRLQQLHEGLERRVEERTRELVDAKEAALTASRLKSEFLTNISHELRTPLNGILGMTDLALQEPLSEEAREMLQTVALCGEDLHRLVNQILDLSRIEAGRLRLEDVPFDPGRLLREIADDGADQARSKGLMFRREMAQDLPSHVSGDPRRLRQALTNVMANAIKFTDRGSVTLRVHNGGEENDRVRLRIEVADTGIGIDEETRARIFDSFVQGDGTLTRRHGGTGLGLAVASTLVKLMGGEICVQSKPGQGSLFTIEVSLRPCAPEVTPEPSGAKRKGPRVKILVVEDNATNRTMVERMLARDEHEVVSAANGSEALRCMRDREFDLVLMDVQMPVMDGFEATAAIRALERETGRHTPVIALTAHAMAGDEQRCLENGMDDYLSKPLAREQLRAMIGKWQCQGASK